MQKIRKRRWTKKEQECFRKLVVQFFIDCEADLIEATSQRAEFVVNSKGGPLHATIYDNWVALRFYDVIRGRELTGESNPFSGKWNFHVMSPTIVPQDAADQLVSRLTLVGITKKATIMAKKAPKKLTTEQMLDYLDDTIVGLWRFRGFGKPPKWAVTMCHQGFYFDTDPCLTREDALREACQVKDTLVQRLGPNPPFPELP